MLEEDVAGLREGASWGAACKSRLEQVQFAVHYLERQLSAALQLSPECSITGAASSFGSTPGALSALAGFSQGGVLDVGGGGGTQTTQVGARAHSVRISNLPLAFDMLLAMLLASPPCVPAHSLPITKPLCSLLEERLLDLWHAQSTTMVEQRLCLEYLLACCASASRAARECGQGLATGKVDGQGTGKLDSQGSGTGKLDSQGLGTGKGDAQGQNKAGPEEEGSQVRTKEETVEGPASGTRTPSGPMNALCVSLVRQVGPAILAYLVQQLERQQRLQPRTAAEFAFFDAACAFVQLLLELAAPDRRMPSMLTILSNYVSIF